MGEEPPMKEARPSISDDFVKDLDDTIDQFSVHGTILRVDWM